MWYQDMKGDLFLVSGEGRSKTLVVPEPGKEGGDPKYVRYTINNTYKKKDRGYVTLFNLSKSEYKYPPVKPSEVRLSYVDAAEQVALMEEEVRAYNSKYGFTVVNGVTRRIEK